jgi:hypothetical protein
MRDAHLTPPRHTPRHEAGHGSGRGASWAQAREQRREGCFKIPSRVSARPSSFTRVLLAYLILLSATPSAHTAVRGAVKVLCIVWTPC